jgi:hypothetical protein
MTETAKLAVDKGHAAGAKVAVELAVKELQEIRRETASPIIIPDRVPPGLGGPGGPRGSGNIQLP